LPGGEQYVATIKCVAVKPAASDYLTALVLAGVNDAAGSMITSSPFLLGAIPDMLGGGTPASPYQIETVAHLKKLANQVNIGDDKTDTYYELVNDLDLSAISNWTPIGTYAIFLPFSGSFDGNGNTISGLKINNDLKSQGLFGYIDGGTVTNLGIVDADITAGNAGGIVGVVNNGNISNCYVTGTISSNGGVGGIACSVFGGSSIINCYFVGDVSGVNYVGGIAGEVNSSSVSKCYAAGTVSGVQFVGGIAGFLYGSVTNCVALNTKLVRTGTSTNTTFGRVAGVLAGGDIPNVIKDNVARSDMQIDFTNAGGGISDTRPGSADGTGIDALSILIADAKTVAFYTTTTHSGPFTLGWNFTAGTGIWEIVTPGTDLPTHQ
jgi:hypothetical protein